MVSKRVEEELERRRDEIEAEVLRRVEEAKKILEAQMLEEMEKRKQEQLEEAKRREVRFISMTYIINTLLELRLTFQYVSYWKTGKSLLCSCQLLNLEKKYNG